MKVWFITGTSKGFGRVWAEAALKRGDKVVATARNLESLKALNDTYGENVMTLALDVTDRAAIFAAVKQAYDTYGRLDVVLNNAGYGQLGAAEEISEQEARDQLETNLFGAIWVTQAVLPYLREQGSGHIVQNSSIGGVNAFPYASLYNTSKWALEGFSQALSQEVQPFGIKVTLIEPVGYATDWSPSAKVARPLPAYEPLREARAANPRPFGAGNPEATGPALLKLVEMEQPPLRIFFGKGAHEMIHAEYGKRLAEWDAFKALSEEAYGA
ncbi:short-chain dehydrogenase/reductase [Reticulibacter mediterranei]|uniref:Short-chain dehydrogenase/reductase n=1 Tax=Reticulibacter mediterranei TaxID=2778369 RepID=A0A8J3IN25_9CHLR|nr:SDR family NAD(P)-dependent oxidoreductase [Reticulibacter mediterranei]GHO97571.1 short-chain dehydrogenase/reductase [Reticulibacter mediterranei]